MKKENINRQEFPAELSSIEEILNSAEAGFLKHDIPSQLSKEYRLVIEELATKLILNARPGAMVTVENSQRLDLVHITLRCPGDPVILEQESEDDFSGKILEDYQDYMNQSYSSGVNIVDFSSASGSTKKWNLIAIVLAVLVAIPIRLFCTEAQIETISEQIIYPMTRFYAGCIQTIAAPVVFFAITALIVKLQHKFDHDRHLFNTFSSYLLSSLAAMVFGFIAAKFYPLNAVTPDLSYLRTGAGISYSSPRDFIDMFTFTNLLEAFQISDPIPMLIIAVLAGIAASRVQGTEGKWVRKAVVALNSLFARMLSIVYSIIPLFLFFSILPNLVTQGFRFVFYVLLVILLFIPLVLMIFAAYAIRLRTVGISPVKFVKDNLDILKENYRIGSNIQAVPYNKRMLGRRIKMSSSALKDRLDLGAMVNMDGNCLVISGFALYMLHACGVEITLGFLLYFAILLILLSVGAPNQPGSMLVAMIFIMGTTGISTDMYDIVIIMEALLGTAYSFINSVGDIVTIASGAEWHKRSGK